MRTLNEHDLEGRVGIGKTSSDDATSGTSSVDVAKTIQDTQSGGMQGRNKDTPCNDHVDFLWVAHADLVQGWGQVSSGKNRDGSLE